MTLCEADIDVIQIVSLVKRDLIDWPDSFAIVTGSFFERPASDFEEQLVGICAILVERVECGVWGSSLVGSKLSTLASMLQQIVVNRESLQLDKATLSESKDWLEIKAVANDLIESAKIREIVISRPIVVANKIELFSFLKKPFRPA